MKKVWAEVEEKVACNVLETLVLKTNERVFGKVHIHSTPCKS